MNILELQIHQNSDQQGWLALELDLLVDGYPLEQFGGHAYGVDLSEYEKSLHADGEFFIISCSCGFARCAGILQGVQVRHEGSLVYWHIPEPEPERWFVFSVQNYEAAYQAVVARGNALIDQFIPSEEVQLEIVAWPSERVFHPIPHLNSEPNLGWITDETEEVDGSSVHIYLN